MEIQPLSGILGAEILNADLRDAASHQQFISALNDYGVITIRDQDLSPEDYIRFAKRFGSINVNRFFTPHPAHGEIAMVVKEKSQAQAIGENWHSDHSYDDAPALYSLLYAVEVPDFGGDTVFSSMAAAFADLSPPMQDFLRGLRARHSSRHVFGAADVAGEARKDGRIGNSAAALQDALHPVVIRHPGSGRLCLYVNPDFTVFIEGLSTAESRALLDFLFSHGSDARFTCRVRWRPRSLTVWDNQAVWHRAMNDYAGVRREMHRITINGPPTVPA